jgi:hypothetical protein
MTAPCPILGFHLELELGPSVPNSDSETLFSALMTLLSRRGLEADGVRRGRIWSYRIRGEGTQATDADRTAILEWASTHTGIVAQRASRIYDLEET